MATQDNLGPQWYHGTNQVPSDKLYRKLESMLSTLDMHPQLVPRQIYMKNDIGVAGGLPARFIPMRFFSKSCVDGR